MNQIINTIPQNGLGLGQTNNINVLLTPEVMVEFYPQLALDIYFLVYLLIRSSKVRLIGYSRHSDYPFGVRLRVAFVVFWIVITIGQMILLIASMIIEKKFWIEEAGGLSGFLSLFYAFHILVLILSVKVYEIERKSRLNTRMKFHRFYWLSYSICYGGTIFYFLLIDDEKEMLYINVMLFMRICVTLFLSLFSIGDTKEFNQNYVYNESQLSEDFIVDNDLHIENKYNTTVQLLTSRLQESAHKQPTYLISVDDEMLFKTTSSGKKERIFVVIIKDQTGRLLSSLQKTYEDFATFKNSMDYNLRHKDLEAPRLGERTFMMVSALPAGYEMFDDEDKADSLTLEDQFANIKLFCEQLARNEEYLIPTFFDFFEIGAQDQIGANAKEESEDNKTETSSFRRTVNRRILGSLAQGRNIGSTGRNRSLKETQRANQELDQEDRASLTQVRNNPTSPNINNKLLRFSSGDHVKWDHFKSDYTRKYCFYFHIFHMGSVKKNTGSNSYILHKFKIECVPFPNLAITIAKRYSEFRAFESQLHSDVKARAPDLPPKLILKNLSSPDSVKRRAEGLKRWLVIVSNEKMFHCRHLFSFLEIPATKVNLYTAYHPIERLYNQFGFDIRIRKFKNVSSEGRDYTFLLYFITVMIVNKDLKTLIGAYVIKRRYSEFRNLNKDLKRKFRKYKNSLPEIPSKISFLKPVSRQYGLEQYLNKLMDYPDVFDCINFRKFLELYPKRFTEMNIRKSVAEE